MAINWYNGKRQPRADKNSNLVRLSSCGKRIRLTFYGDTAKKVMTANGRIDIGYDDDEKKFVIYPNKLGSHTLSLDSPNNKYVTIFCVSESRFRQLSPYFGLYELRKLANPSGYYLDLGGTE